MGCSSPPTQYQSPAVAKGVQQNHPLPSRKRITTPHPTPTKGKSAAVVPLVLDHITSKNSGATEAIEAEGAEAAVAEDRLIFGLPPAAFGSERFRRG